MEVLLANPVVFTQNSLSLIPQVWGVVNMVVVFGKLFWMVYPKVLKHSHQEHCRFCYRFASCLYKLVLKAWLWLVMMGMKCICFGVFDNHHKDFIIWLWQTKKQHSCQLHHDHTYPRVHHQSSFHQVLLRYQTVFELLGWGATLPQAWFCDRIELPNYAKF